MKFISTLLLVEAALGAHLTQQRREKHEKTIHARQFNWNPNPMNGNSNSGNSNNSSNGNTNTAQPEYSDNWAGGVITSTNVTSVTATVTVPSVSAPTDAESSSSKYCIAAWVGIDGHDCSGAILQAGVDFCIENGKLSYSSWYEWYPAGFYDFELELSEGDVIAMTMTAASYTAGTAVLENLTTGQTVRHSFGGQEIEAELCLVNAEWIVEDYEDMEPSSLIPLANFGNFTFTKASAIADGKTVGPSDGIVMDIEQSGRVYTSCSTATDSVTCLYL